MATPDPLEIGQTCTGVDIANCECKGTLKSAWKIKSKESSFDSQNIESVCLVIDNTHVP